MKKKRTPSIDPAVKPTINVIVDPLGNEGLIKNGLIALYDPGKKIIQGTTGQSLIDYSGKGNHAQLGSTSGSDTNDPSFTGNGIQFGLDDYLKCTQNVFDDMAQFTCITVFKANSYGSGGFARLMHKNTREIVVTSLNVMRFTQSRTVNFDIWDATFSNLLNTNNVFSITFNSTTPDISPVVYQNNSKINCVRTTTGTGVCLSDASTDLYIGNKSDASRNFDGTIYAQVWYNRILSDSEYLYNYNYLKKLMVSRGITI